MLTIAKKLQRTITVLCTGTALFDRSQLGFASVNRIRVTIPVSFITNRATHPLCTGGAPIIIPALNLAFPAMIRHDLQVKILIGLPVTIIILVIAYLCRALVLTAVEPHGTGHTCIV